MPDHTTTYTPPHTALQITGLILAGGRGSRMGGTDKGLQELNGKSMVRHVLERLRPQVTRIAISANQNPAGYARFLYPVLADVRPGFLGPLAGLEAGLIHCTTPYLVTAPCDSPFLPLDLVSRLMDGLIEQHADLAVACTGDIAGPQPQPVFCLLKTTCLPVLQAYLRGGGRTMRHWHKPLAMAQVHFSDDMAFRNINTLRELQECTLPVSAS